jgi:hypothetical protein
MCKSKQTRRAWPLVKKLLNPSDFVARVELTIKQIEEEERGSGRSIAQQS